MGSPETIALDRVMFPWPTGLSCDPCTETLSANVPETGRFLPASSSSSSRDRRDPTRLMLTGDESLYDQLFNPTCRLKVNRPSRADCSSPFCNEADDGLASMSVRRTFHELPFTRRLEASSLPRTWGFATDPVIDALNCAVP